MYVHSFRNVGTISKFLIFTSLITWFMYFQVPIKFRPLCKRCFLHVVVFIYQLGGFFPPPFSGKMNAMFWDFFKEILKQKWKLFEEVLVTKYKLKGLV